MLSISRLQGESWLECALRYGRKYGLEEEVDYQYHIFIGQGDTEEEAAWGACLEWDLADFNTTDEIVQ